MPDGQPTEYLAECFWPGVQQEDLRLLDERSAAAAADLALAGEPIRYLGSILVRVDEVVLCLFEGPEHAVRAAAERAQIPFERILETARSPWPAPEATST
jgi:Nickel responsive protein SCO4226-like